MKYLRWISAALAVPLLAVGTARADFNYTTAVTPASPTGPGGAPGLAFGGDSSLTYDPPTPPPGTQSTLLGSVGISIAAVTVDRSLTGAQGAESTSSTITDTVTIMPTTGGSGVLTVVGTAAAQTGFDGTNASQTSSFTYTGGITSVQIGNLIYSYATSGIFGPSYSQPTVNVADSGGLSITIFVTAVPEPASVAMLGVGGLLLVAPRLRRLARRIARPELA